MSTIYRLKPGEQQAVSGGPSGALVAMFDLPTVDEYGPCERGQRFGGVSAQSDGEAVIVQGQQFMGPDVALAFAAYVAACAVHVQDREPSKADLDALATLIAGCVDPDADAISTARAILRAGYKPPERES
jgi:hypothetical protein